MDLIGKVEFKNNYFKDKQSIVFFIPLIFTDTIFVEFLLKFLIIYK